MPRKALSTRTIAASIAMLLAVDGRQAFADNLQRLSRAGIRGRLSGKQFTDEVRMARTVWALLRPERTYQAVSITA